MASSIQTPMALPNEVNYTLPSSLPSAVNREVRVQPVNSQNFTSGQVIQIDIPCGQQGDYLDPYTTYVRFRATYINGTATEVAGTDYAYLIGSGYSYFNKQEVYGNNSNVLESINEVGVLANMLFNCQLSDSDKRGLSGMIGFSTQNYSNTVAVGAGAATPAAQNTTYLGTQSSAGHRINMTTTNEGLAFEYAIPLIGILGSGTSKLIPVGKLFSLRLELTMDNFTNFCVMATTKPLTSCTITSFEFVANYIRLSPEAEQMINQQNPEKIHIRTQTWKQTSGQLGAAASAATSGTYDILCSIRVNSLKSIYAVISPSTAAEGKFAGVNPCLTQGTCFLISGGQYPQRTLDPSNKPADAFAELQKSFGALSYNAYNSCISKAGYYVSSTANGLCPAFTAYVVGTAPNTIIEAPNMFYLGIDTEVLARKDSLLSGANTTTAPMQFRCQVGATTAAVVHTINFFGFYDVIIELDVQSRNVVALV